MSEGVKSHEASPDRQSSELDRRKRGLSNWVEHRVLGKNKSLDIDLTDSFADFSTREKADLLYGKLMAYTVTDRMIGEEKKKDPLTEPETVDPYLISEIKSLWDDESARDMFVSRFGEARFDARAQHHSELGRKWQGINEQIADTREAYEAGMRQLFLGQLRRPDQISAARGRGQRFAKELINLHDKKDAVVHLEGLPHIAENTDTAAAIMYDTLVNYHEQAKKGFVWLPSRVRIHEQTIAALQNGRWPVLRGEAGTGKSEQADAAAVALTGEQPTHLACGPNTASRELIADRDIDPATGGGYEIYGAAMQAATGYTDSRTDEPEYKTGRIVRFDESGRLGPKGYAEIKELRQKKPATQDDITRWKNGASIDIGKLLHGKPVLPGFAAIFTTNPEGSRYPDRTEPDPALRRELSYIPNDYPEMTISNPELYEFMLSTLMDDNKHIPVAEKELAPAYRIVSADKVLPDGRKILSEQELHEDPTNREHGILYRLSFALRSLQDAFNNGNKTTIPEDALRYSITADDKLQIVPNGGDPLTLSTSTITLSDIKSWMQGFHERRLKDDPAYQVNTLTEWVQMKLNGYLNQADEDDQEKIRAIFAHYHLFEAPWDQAAAKPILPKEIGYLSPRVPRPVEIAPESVVEEKDKAREQSRFPDQRLYEDISCMLEDGTEVKALLRPLEFEKMGKKIRLKNGRRFLLGPDKFRFVGFSPENDKVVVRIDTGREDEALHRVFTIAELQDNGEFKVQTEEMKELFADRYMGPEAVKKTWGVDIPEEVVPDIEDQFSQEVLERANELGLILMLRIDKAPDGKPLTMQKMEEMLQPQLTAAGKGKIFYNTNSYKDQKFFKEDAPQFRWALVSEKVLPDSTDKNYLEQTQILADYIKNVFFAGGEPPAIYQEALTEFEREKTGIASLMTPSDWRKAADRLCSLRLNQLCRRTAPEAPYDLLMNIQERNKRLLEHEYDWLLSQTSDGRLVFVGYFDAEGAVVHSAHPGHSYSDLGVCLQIVSTF